jgi:peptidylprolyl isomerase
VLVAAAAALSLTSCASGSPEGGESPADQPASAQTDDAEAQVPAEGTDAGVVTESAPAPDLGDSEASVPRASGEPVEPAPGLPTVTLQEDGTPNLEPVVGEEPPAGLVTQTLIAGPGEPVAEGSEITAQYAGWLWDGTPFDSSWSRGGEPFTAFLDPTSLIEGWVQGLVGQTVGSQVLLIVPPELGYGDRDMGTIPPNSTLVFVIDIISAS